MIKPMGVLLVLGVVLILDFCLVPVLWGMVRCIRSHRRKTALLLGSVALVIVVFSVSAVFAVAPKGGRTLAQLDTADGRAFLVRHYRSGWLEYPKARFYARNAQGAWTSFGLISELVPGSTSLVPDASGQEVQVPGVGWYRVQDNDFVNPDGSRGPVSQLPPGIEPGMEEIR